MAGRRIAMRMFLFGCMGLVFEIFYIALHDAVFGGNWNLRGHSSLWMIPVYALPGLLTGTVSNRLKNRHIPLPFRAFIYMLMIFAVEYVSGVLFTAAGLDIWNYSNLRWNLHGHIALSYVPVWYFLALWLEYLYQLIDGCACVLVKSHKTTQ